MGGVWPLERDFGFYGRCHRHVVDRTPRETCGCDEAADRTGQRSGDQQFPDSVPETHGGPERSDGGLEIELVYLPPYHSKYNPIERFWGVLEQHWNGTLLSSVQIVVNWAQTSTWRGVSPIVRQIQETYHTGVTIGRTAFREIKARLQRHETLPKWSLTIKPNPVL